MTFVHYRKRKRLNYIRNFRDTYSYLDGGCGIRVVVVPAVLRFAGVTSVTKRSIGGSSGPHAREKVGARERDVKRER